MVKKEHLISELAEFSIVVDQDNILDKCVSLCSSYSLTARDFVASWVALSTSRLNGTDPTLEYLEQLEREELGKLHKGRPDHTGSGQTEELVIYDASTIDELAADYNILAEYGSPSSKKSAKRQLTPNQHGSKRVASTTRSPVIAFSPASFSPNTAHASQKYSTRRNAGEVLAKFGDSSSAWKQSNARWQPSVEHYGAEPLTTRFKYMFERLRDKAAVLDEMIGQVGSYLVKKYNLEEPTHIRLPKPDCVTAVGRICCDSNGKLNASSVLLEGNQEICSGFTVGLDVKALPEYSLFPGQIVAVEGVNSMGKKLVVKKIYNDATLPLPDTKPLITKETGPLQVVIAVGPFTPSDSLCYEPLSDLVQYIQKHEPHVAVLIGPFVDCKHQAVESDDLAETFEQMFEKQLERLREAVKDLNSQLIVVPSWRDVHHEFVYPTPPFSSRKTGSQIHFVPDPCVLSVEGVIFGITSTDILFHMGKEEISWPPQGSDRLGRLAGHILNQQCFYPLCPSSEEVTVDYEKMEEHTFLPVTPHILVLPSDLKYFFKNIEGCFVLNPGRTTKGMVGGTLAHLEIHPIKDGQKSVIDSVRGEIVRL